VRIDRTKLAAAQRILGLATATATIDAALDSIAFLGEALAGVDALVAAGGLAREPDE
jgi:hypothetical protein